MAGRHQIKQPPTHCHLSPYPTVALSDSASSSLPAVTCADGTYVIGTPSRAATFGCNSFVISENATATSNAEALAAGQPMSQHAECKFTDYERRCSTDCFETILWSIVACTIHRRCGPELATTTGDGPLGGPDGFDSPHPLQSC
jgi:hypothetical protein